MKMVCCWILITLLLLRYLSLVASSYNEKEGFVRFITYTILVTLSFALYHGAGVINGALTGR